jgi:hypothetical protein
MYDRLSALAEELTNVKSSRVDYVYISSTARQLAAKVRFVQLTLESAQELERLDGTQKSKPPSITP